MDIEIETTAERTDHGWRDLHGFVGPFRPGVGPRTDPRGTFPTGPDVGAALSNFQCSDADGNEFDLHRARGEQPAVMLFYRSAVW